MLALSLDEETHDVVLRLKKDHDSWMQEAGQAVRYDEIRNLLEKAKKAGSLMQQTIEKIPVEKRTEDEILWLEMAPEAQETIDNFLTNLDLEKEKLKIIPEAKSSTRRISQTREEKTKEIMLYNLLREADHLSMKNFYRLYWEDPLNKIKTGLAALRRFQECIKLLETIPDREKQKHFLFPKYSEELNKQKENLKTTENFLNNWQAELTKPEHPLGPDGEEKIFDHDIADIALTRAIHHHVNALKLMNTDKTEARQECLRAERALQTAIIRFGEKNEKNEKSLKYCKDSQRVLARLSLYITEAITRDNLLPLKAKTILASQGVETKELEHNQKEAKTCLERARRAYKLHFEAWEKEFYYYSDADFKAVVNNPKILPKTKEPLADLTRAITQYENAGKFLVAIPENKRTKEDYQSLLEVTFKYQILTARKKTLDIFIPPEQPAKKHTSSTAASQNANFARRNLAKKLQEEADNYDYLAQMAFLRKHKEKFKKCILFAGAGYQDAIKMLEAIPESERTTEDKCLLAVCKKRYETMQKEHAGKYTVIVREEQDAKASAISQITSPLPAHDVPPPVASHSPSPSPAVTQPGELKDAEYYTKLAIEAHARKDYTAAESAFAEAKKYYQAALAFKSTSATALDTKAIVPASSSHGQRPTTPPAAEKKAEKEVQNLRELVVTSKTKGQVFLDEINNNHNVSGATYGLAIARFEEASVAMRTIPEEKRTDLEKESLNNANPQRIQNLRTLLSRLPEAKEELRVGVTVNDLFNTAQEKFQVIINNPNLIFSQRIENFISAKMGYENIQAIIQTVDPKDRTRGETFFLEKWLPSRLAFIDSILKIIQPQKQKAPDCYAATFQPKPTPPTQPLPPPNYLPNYQPPDTPGPMIKPCEI